MAKRSALGKGLGAFFGEDVAKPEHKHIHSEKVESVNEAAEDKAAENKVVEGKAVEDNVVEATVNTVNRIGSSEKTVFEEEASVFATAGAHTLDTHLDNSSQMDATAFLSEPLSKPEESKNEENVSRETFVKLTEIEPNIGQPRKKFDEQELLELANSMKNYGIIQPLIVQKNGDRYQIIAGERRWRAAKLADLKEVPVIVREYDRQQSMEIALIENVQRADLNPMEEARAYQELIQEFGLKQDEIAERVAKSRTTITNSLRLLKLAPEVQQMLIEEKLTNGHARALLALEDHDVQVMTAVEIVEKGMSVREVEKLVKLLLKPKKEPKEAEEKERDYSFIFRDLEERMKGVMGTKVQIHQKDKNKGRIEIEYYSDSELERIVELIESIQ